MPEPTDGVERAAPAREKDLLWVSLASIVIPFLNSVGKLRITGAEHVPASGSFVVAPNHVTNLDPLVMAYALYKSGRVPRFLAKESLFRVPGLGGILRATGQVPVDRSGSGRAGAPLAAARELVERDAGVIVYPEGTLTRDPDEWPMRGKSGAVRIALEAGVPLVPAAHWGAQRILPRYGGRMSLFPRKRVDIVFGAPVDLGEFAGRQLTRAELDAATERVMTAVTALVADLRGEPAPTGRWDVHAGARIDVTGATS